MADNRGLSSLLTHRLGRLGVSLICVSFGLYCGVLFREELELKRKEEERRERLIEARVSKALNRTK